jgi:hypothetical protein
MRITTRKAKRILGVSTVVGNMLMIAITLSLAAILVAWAGTSYGAFTSGSQLYFAQRQQALQERLVIENVLFNNTNPSNANRLLIFVRNVGLEQVNIVAIYVNGTSLSPEAPTTPGTQHILCTLPQNATLGVGSVCEYNVLVTSVLTGGAVCGSTWCSGTMFYIIVATARGNQATYIARGP